MVCWFFQFWHYFDLVKRVKFGVSGHIQENAWREWPEICTLMYLDHFQDWLVYGDSLLIVLILALFWLSETGQIWGFRSFPGERMEEMTWILHSDVSWPPSDLISLWSCSVDFLKILALFWLSETGQIWGFHAFSGKPIKEMAWNFAC